MIQFTQLKGEQSPMKEMFLLDPEVIFLNHGSFGATPRPVFESYQRWQLELEKQPVEFLGRRSDVLLDNARSILAEAYIQTDGKNAWLMNAHIAPYEQANRFNHDPKRPRQLLLHKREVRAMWEAVRQKGMTIVPVQVYLKDGRAKVEISLAKGKKLYDKRQDLARKDQARELERERKEQS